MLPSPCIDSSPPPPHQILKSLPANMGAPNEPLLHVLNTCVKPCYVHMMCTLAKVHIIFSGMHKTLEKEKSIILEISIKNKNHVMNHFRLNYLTLLRLTRLHQNFLIPI